MNQYLFFFLVLEMIILSPATYAQDTKPFKLWGVDSNIDESRVPDYTLPDPRVKPGGSPIETVAQWETYRSELVDLMAREMYGRLPELLRKAGNHPDFVTFSVQELSGDAFNGKAIRRQIIIEFHEPVSNAIKQTVSLLVYIPRHVSKPCPAFVGLNFQGNHTVCDDPNICMPAVESGKSESGKALAERGSASSRWPIERILDSGFAIATAYYAQIVPDRNITPDSYGPPTEGIFSLYSSYSAEQPRPRDEWGFISAWAYGLSRILDYLETDRDIDGARVAVIGHSRLGKTALWASALDSRFAMVISNDSGCGGAALNYREFGERVLLHNTVRPYWFCLNWQKYGNAVTSMPFDSHTLIALQAPRPVYVASATQDPNADPRGEFLALVHAQGVYDLYGLKGVVDAPISLTRSADNQISLPDPNQSIGSHLRYHIREGKHDIQLFDWEQYIQFAQEKLPPKSQR